MTATPTFPIAITLNIEVTDKYVLATVSQQIREEQGVLGVDDLTSEAQAVKVLGDLLSPVFQPNATGMVFHDLKGYSGPIWANAQAKLASVLNLARALDGGGADRNEYDEGQAALAREIIDLIEE